MMQTKKKQKLEQLRRWRIRKKVVGTTERPRMSVRFTNMHVYVQFVDDSKGATLAATSSRSKGTQGAEKHSANIDGATRIGKLAAEIAQSKGINSVVFDRSGARYHGKLKALADAAREGGLKF
jgi:large subunit ribosomal protein L18